MFVNINQFVCFAEIPIGKNKLLINKLNISFFRVLNSEAFVAKTEKLTNRRRGGPLMWTNSSARKEIDANENITVGRAVRAG